MKYSEILKKLLIMTQREYLFEKEIKLFTSFVKRLLPDNYQFEEDTTLDDFCNDNSTFITKVDKLIIKLKPDEEINKALYFECSKEFTIFYDAYQQLKAAYEMPKKYLKLQQADLQYFKYLEKTDRKKAEEVARRNLISAGIISEDGSLRPPYNGTRVNPNDFTEGPRLVKKNKN